jgi:hypothetical protein
MISGSFLLLVLLSGRGMPKELFIIRLREKLSQEKHGVAADQFR